MEYVQPTPSLGWVLATQAGMPAKAVTPLGAWLALRGPMVDALAAAASYEDEKAARAALREFDRKNPRPHAAKAWKDVGRDDPLLQAIFG